MQLRPTEPGHSPGVAAVVGDEIGGLHGSARGLMDAAIGELERAITLNVDFIALSQPWSHELNRFARLHETGVEQVENGNAPAVDGYGLRPTYRRSRDGLKMARDPPLYQREESAT